MPTHRGRVLVQAFGPGATPLSLPREAPGVSTLQREFAINNSITKLEATAHNAKLPLDHAAGHNLTSQTFLAPQGNIFDDDPGADAVVGVKSRAKSAKPSQ